MTAAGPHHRWRLLNALFAPLTGQDLYLAQQIDAAIASTLEEALADGRPVGDPAFLAAAVQLLGRLHGQAQRHGFFHWDAAGDATAAAPLFARAGLMAGLKQLAIFPEATLLVTNLRAAHCPPARRWTERRRRDYDDALRFLRELTAARTRPGARVNLLFL